MMIAHGARATRRVAQRVTGSRILILSAGVGGGHLAAAQGLQLELMTVAPQVQVALRNGLGDDDTPLRFLLERVTRWQLAVAPRVYGWAYDSFVRSTVGRGMTMRALFTATGRALRELIDSERPDLVVSTYPGITAPLGMLRASGQLTTPVCAVITDMASLHFWAHPGVDLHLASYAESLGEIAVISDGAPARVVRAPLHRDHWELHDRCVRRAELGLGDRERLVVVSGGGWGVGDLRGAVDAALRVSDVRVAIVCGQNARVASRLAREFNAQTRVQVLGFVSAMAPLLSAADVLVHSTGGMTCLEAAASGCPSIAYGFAHGHVKHNVSAMARHGRLAHAADALELTELLRDTLDAGPREAPPAGSHMWASAAILGMLAS